MSNSIAVETDTLSGVARHGHCSLGVARAFLACPHGYFFLYRLLFQFRFAFIFRSLLPRGFFKSFLSLFSLHYLTNRGRHYLLDVLCGALLGLVQYATVVSLLWLPLSNCVHVRDSIFFAIRPS